MGMGGWGIVDEKMVRARYWVKFIDGGGWGMFRGKVQARGGEASFVRLLAGTEVKKGSVLGGGEVPVAGMGLNRVWL